MLQFVLTTLGENLKRARTAKALSLQAAGDSAGISAAYLQKLERGLVESPSPRVLGRLSHALGVSYLRLMEAAGYLDEEQLIAARARVPQPHPLAEQQLSPQEWRKVAEFIQQIVDHRSKRRPAYGIQGKQGARGRGRTKE